MQNFDFQCLEKSAGIFLNMASIFNAPGIKRLRLDFRFGAECRL